MEIAPIPYDESNRLKALEKYNILDSAANKIFYDLTELAAAVCKVPIAMITLIDKDREWYYAKIGIDDVEAARDIAFCAHTILQKDTLIVPDALEDKRFFDNPFVTDDPPLRFYAAAPLITPEGYAIGTLCVIDNVPKEIDEEQINLLEKISGSIVDQLEFEHKFNGFLSREIQTEELFKKISAAANQATSIEEAVKTCIDKICAYTGWPVGHAYLLNEETNMLESMKIWHLADSHRYAAFQEVSESYQFKYGEGLPGRVLKSGQPAWIVDVTKDDNFPRAKLVQNIGIRAGLAFPVLVKDEVKAVLEFFTLEGIEPDLKILDIMAYVGIEIGRVIERAVAQKKLSESKEQLRLIADSVPALITYVDSNYRYQYMNEPFKKLFKTVHHQMILGKTIEEIYEKSHYEIVSPYIKTALSGQKVNFEYTYNIRGKDCLFDINYIPHITSDGQVVGIYMMSNDITLRKQAEEKLQEDLRVQSMLSQCNEVLIHASNEKDLLDNICSIIVNIGGYIMSGVGFIAHDGKRSVNMIASYGHNDGYLEAVNVSWADNERGQGPVGIAIRSRQPYIVRDIVTDPGFSPWREAALQRGYASVIALPLIYDGNVGAVLLVYSTVVNRFDDGEVKLLEQLAANLAFGINTMRTRIEREEASEQLVHAQKMDILGQMAGSIAHDFNNLLSVVIGNLEFLQEGIGDSMAEDDQSMIKSALKAAKSGAKLTHGLLTISRKQVLQPKDLEINIVVEDFINLAARTLGKHIDIVSITDPQPLFVYADPSQLENALFNLAFNSRDAMPNGGTLTVEVGRKQLEAPNSAEGETLDTGLYAIISITDTGIGMSQELIKKAQEPFFTTKGIGKGTGLG